MKPFVRVLGSAVLAGCHAHETPEITRNPPAPSLPTWDEVKSGHPEGATNPPSPTLYVARDTGACFKVWLPGMIRPADDILAVGGRVYDHQADIAEGTQVVCPDGEPARLLADYDAAKANGFQ